MRTASGARIELFETLDSTSLEVKRRAASGEKGPLWIAAICQTSGYGRRGSPWSQHEGDFAATFLFDQDADASTLPQLSFVAALAVFDAIGRFAPSAPLALKWPNDILAGNGKIAGLLLELLGPSDAQAVALGVGVNIVTAPTGLEYPAARLLDLAGAPPQPLEFLSELDETLTYWRVKWIKSGFGPIRAEWLRRAARLGEYIKVRLAQETLEGVFADLDFDGALILDCPEGRRRIVAGAVLPLNCPREESAGRNGNAHCN